MRKYGYFRSMLMSFYSRDLYRDVEQNWGATVLWYLFLVLFIYCAIATGRTQTKVNAFLPRFLAPYTVQFPEVVIKNGLAQTAENKPYLITTPNTKEVFAIIDTSGKYTSLDQTKATFLLTKTSYMYNTKYFSKKIDFAKTLNTDLKPLEIQKKVLEWAKWMWIVILPLFLLISYVYRVGQAFVYAFFGKIMALVLSARLSYFDILKLSMVAVTPAIFIKLAVVLTIGHLHFGWLIYFIIAMLYLMFALSSVRK